MSNAIQERKNEVVALLANKEVQERLCALCGDEMSKEKFKASLLNIALDSNLARCSIQSIVKASLDIAGLRLSLNKNLGKAYIVPRSVRNGDSYVSEARIDIGYKGWLELAKRSGLSVKAHSVFECDEFKFQVLGGDEDLILTPNFDERQEYDTKWVKENLKGVIVIIKDLKSGEKEIKFVSKGTLFKIMEQNDSVKRGKHSAYSEWMHEMFLAKAIKSCISKTAMSEELGLAVSYDNENEQDFTPSAPKPKKEARKFDYNLFMQSNKAEAAEVEVIEAEITESDMPF